MNGTAGDNINKRRTGAEGEKTNKRKTGAKYETAACRYLEEHGYSVIRRNFHAGRSGEIDIIAEDSSGILVFCECKYRHDSRYGDPLEAVDRRKQHQICRIALRYCMLHNIPSSYPCRFDVIGITGDGTLKHIENAFPFC